MSSEAMHACNACTSVSNVPSPGLGYGVQLIKEEHAGSGCTGLVKHVSNVGLGLSKPHSQQFWALQEGREGERRGGEGEVQLKS